MAWHGACAAPDTVADQEHAEINPLVPSDTGPSKLVVPGRNVKKTIKKHQMSSILD
jgi:hypothetical protein